MMSTSLVIPAEQCIHPLFSAVVALEAFDLRKGSENGGILSHRGAAPRIPLLTENVDGLDALLYLQEDDYEESRALVDVPSLLNSVVAIRGGSDSSSSLLFDDLHHPLAFATPHVHHQSVPLHSAVAASSIQPSPDEHSLEESCSTVGDDQSSASQAVVGSVMLNDEDDVTAKQQQDRPRWFRWRFRIGRQRSRSGSTSLDQPTPTANATTVAEQEIPLRFQRAAKGNPALGRQRYHDTLKWRKQYHMDTILMEPHSHFEFIKEHYPHYFHLRGKNGEPVYFEMPPKTNLKALRQGGVTLDILLRHYAMVTEFTWQYVSRDPLKQSIYVIDLKGIRPRDFVGECVAFVRKACAFCNQHYPERSGCIFVINVPTYFQLIWRVVKKFADKKTLGKVKILRGKDDILNGLLEYIDIQNIPPEYGGTNTSMSLGEAPEEKLLWELMRHNNHVALHGTKDCGGREGGCPYCSFEPARNY